jgi:hypothetical protein
MCRVRLGEARRQTLELVEELTGDAAVVIHAALDLVEERSNDSQIQLETRASVHR